MILKVNINIQNREFSKYIFLRANNNEGFDKYGKCSSFSWRLQAVIEVALHEVLDLFIIYILRVSDSILRKDKTCVEGQLIKADSLFNLSEFEKALVLYHRLPPRIIYIGW